MKNSGKIFLAFILNSVFSLFEFYGGIYTGSSAILSDALHDLGDALGIGLSWLLERKSRREADERYTFGYLRYSVLGSVITSLILIFGSISAACNGIYRILFPTEIDYTGMIVFAVIGTAVNGAAALITGGEGSLNRKTVNLHMLEDVLGWLVVLIGAAVMHFTDFYLLDPILSVGTAVFILWHAVKNLREASEIFLEKAPDDMDVSHLISHLTAADGVLEVHHVHVWSMDGRNHCASMHVVTDGEHGAVRSSLRKALKEYGISHGVLELESPDEIGGERECRMEPSEECGHHHHHH